MSVGALHDEPDERRWWWRRSPLERLAAIEAMRRVVCGRAATHGRLQRVLEILVISLDDLKTNKRAAGRNKDLADLDNLP
jgi:hypothetical protein